MKHTIRLLLAVLTALILSLGSGCSEADSASKPSKTTVKKAELGDRILDLNQATIEELMMLPGVGEVTAQRIIAGRPYKSVDDLDKIEGIGEKTLEKLRPHLEVKPAAPAE